jgi:hypothetical protein
MTSQRKRKVVICCAVLRDEARNPLEGRLWDRMPPAGREFGCPEFERLMGEARGKRFEHENKLLAGSGKKMRPAGEAHAAT